MSWRIFALNYFCTYPILHFSCLQALPRMNHPLLILVTLLLSMVLILNRAKHMSWSLVKTTLIKCLEFICWIKYLPTCSNLLSRLLPHFLIIHSTKYLKNVVLMKVHSLLTSLNWSLVLPIKLFLVKCYTPIICYI